MNVLEGAISGKKAVGRPRLRFLKQVARNTAADGYTAMERVACNSCRWKAANQSEDWRIRRRCTVYVGVGAKLCTTDLYFRIFRYVLAVNANKMHYF